MSNFPCPDQIDNCPCDVSPYKNLSSEAPDLPVFFSTAFAKFLPPLGSAGGPVPCQVVCESTVSQQAADLCAQEQAQECSTSPWTSAVNGGVTTPPFAPPVPPPENTEGGNPFPRLFNQQQSCGAPCPDGSVFTYTVPAGVFSALALGNSAAAVAAGQAKANAEAFSYACRQAQLHQVCLGPIVVVQFACADTPYLATIQATGRFLAVAPQADSWAIIAGALPPGLTFTGAPNGGLATIDGTPTQIGTFTFTVQITTPSGDTMSKQYTSTVGGIPNAGSQPDGMVGTAYSEQLMDVGFVDPVFSLVSGSLPDGLTLSDSGLISGTPTTGQTTTATVQVAEASAPNLACQAEITITIAPALGFKFNIPWTNLGDTSAGAGSASAVTAPAHVVIDGTSPGVFDRGSMDDFGETPQMYTGPSTACNLHLVMAGSGAIAFTITILQNGNPILQQSVVNAVGTFDFPFTVAAGVNSPVQMSFLEVSSVGGGSVHADATLTPS